LVIAKQLGDLLVGLLAEQPDDDGAEVLVARPRSLSMLLTTLSSSQTKYPP
jgi:hypothetical protein